MVQWLSLCASCVEGAGSIPGWGTNSLHAAQSGQKKVGSPMETELQEGAMSCLPLYH